MVNEAWTKAIKELREEADKSRAVLCPTTGKEHRLDDGKCLDCTFDVEFTRL